MRLSGQTQFFLRRYFKLKKHTQNKQFPPSYEVLSMKIVAFVV